MMTIARVGRSSGMSVEIFDVMQLFWELGELGMET